MSELVLGTKMGETIVVTCSCGKTFEFCSAPPEAWKQIFFDAPPETVIHREPKKTRLIEEGS